MRSSFAVCIVALLFLVWAAYAMWQAWTLGSLASAAFGLLGLFGAGSLLLGRDWAQYVVYGLLALMVLTWGYTVWQVARAGWPYSDLTSTILSLVPGAVLVVACAGSAFIVFRHFHR